MSFAALTCTNIYYETINPNFPGNLQIDVLIAAPAPGVDVAGQHDLVRFAFDVLAILHGGRFVEFGPQARVTGFLQGPTDPAFSRAYGRGPSAELPLTCAGASSPSFRPLRRTILLRSRIGCYGGQETGKISGNFPGFGTDSAEPEPASD